MEPELYSSDFTGGNENSLLNVHRPTAIIAYLIGPLNEHVAFSRSGLVGLARLVNDDDLNTGRYRWRGRQGGSDARRWRRRI